MAAQVEVQTGEVGRTIAGGRLHLSPLTDSSNKSLIEIPSINQSHIITPEPNKPVPGPKPRLTPKPFAVERNPTIKPILAPKPQTKPRPESTRLVGYNPELSCSPKPQEPFASGKPRSVSANPNRPSPTSFKTYNKSNTGQTTKPIVQSFKPAPPLDPAEPKPIQTVTSSLVYSKSLKQLPAAEWSGITQNQNEKDQMASSKGGAFITRAKSMGFLVQVGQEEEESEKANPKVAVPLRPQPRGTRPRPVSAIFLESPTKAQTPVPAPRWARRPLSADLTAKFESIGLSLHRKTPKGNSKENNPEETVRSQKSEQEKTPKSTTSTDGVAQPAVSDQSNKKTEEIMTVKETDEDKCAVSIKSRISLLLDSSPSPGTGVTGQGSDFHSPGQAIPDTETPVGVKHLIKQLTEDTIPTQNTVVKPALKPRPLPLDLTKRFSAERSPDLASVSLSEETDRLEISKDPQRRIEESTITPNDQRTFLDLKDSQKQLKKSSTPEGHEVGQMFGATPKESGARSDVQTVRASLFENVVERHSVLMVEEGKPVKKANDLLSSPSFKRGNVEDEGTLVTATYKEPVSPSNPLRVSHAFDTVQAVEESRAVSEKIPSAQLEDKAMTLRSRHSEGSRVVAERTASAQGQPASAMMSEQQPRYLRVGALHKWTSSGLDQKTSVEKGMLKESQRDGQVTLNQDRDRLREAEQEEVAAAPKRLKMLQAEEQPRPRATYFALTGQIQEPDSPVDAGASIGDMSGPYDDFSVRSVPGISQGKLIPIKRHPSLDGAFGKNSRDQVEELMMRNHVSPREITSTLDGQTTAEIMDVEKKRELKKENERHMSKMKELEREKQRQLEIEKEAHLQFAQMKEREMQREFERQRQKSFKKEKLEFDEKQRALERQKRLELEQKQKLQELETVRLREVEKERQLQLEKEKHQKLERRRKIEREKLQEQEREREREQDRQRQREEERQRELDREIQLLEIQKEKRKMEELERIKAMERLQLLEFQKQKEKERERQQLMELEKQRLGEKMGREEAEKIKRVALEQEMLRMKEIEKERQREKEHHKAIEREKQRELERQRHRDLERERQRQLDIEKQELESQRFRQRELDKERQRKEELERNIEMERRQLLELEKQKQAERDRQQMFELENRRQRERIEREEAEKMRQIAKQQEAERQRLKERQKKEEQERARLESSLRPQVVDLDAVLRNDPVSKAPSQRSDPATRWKEPSPRAEESYKPAILDIDSFTSQVQLSPSKDFFPDSGFPGVDAAYGARLQPAPAEEVSWRLPQQTSVSFTSPVWTTSPQDPWELQPFEMSVDKPMAQSRKHGSKLSPDQLRQEERLLAPQRHWSVVLGEPLPLTTLSQTEVKSSASEENVWLPREPQDSRGEVRSHRRSQGSQEINRMRSRSVSRRSAPPCSAVDGGFSRVRSRSAHREQDHDSEVQQKQSVRGEEEWKDSGSPVRDTDSQYGTWETGLRSDESLTPATPSSESNLSSSPRKPSPPHTPGDPASLFDTVDSLPSSSSSESQPLSFPDAPTTLLDTRALRSRAQLGKKRAPRTRPSRVARQTALLSEGGTPEDWLYRDSTEARVESKANDSDSEEQARGGDSAVSSQPPRVALFPGMDPSALKAQLKKRGDSDNLIDAPTPSPSQLCLSPKSPFLPGAARVLPPPGGKENGEEDSPQWLKELKSKKRLSQYENDS